MKNADLFRNALSADDRWDSAEPPVESEPCEHRWYWDIEQEASVCSKCHAGLDHHFTPNCDRHFPDTCWWCGGPKADHGEKA